MLTPEISNALEQLNELFSGHRIDVQPEPDGGARVVIHDLDIGPRFVPNVTWCGFAIPFQYPRADVYPHFIDAAVKRIDGQALGQGLQPATWANAPAIQVSRRSNRWDPTIDTAALKLIKVLDWLRSQ